MRLSFVLASSAYVLLFVGTQASALPPVDFCELNPTSPLCIGEEPPIDPPDPCVENPQLCEPPPDPCKLDPASCEPEPEPEPPADGSSAALEGTFVLKGNGFKGSFEADVALSFDETTFSLVLFSGAPIMTGNLVPKGKKGNKFQLFLDDASADWLATVVAHEAALASGRETGNPLGETSKLILKRNADGTATLKIKSHVLVDSVGEAVFKANLTGPVGAS